MQRRAFIHLIGGMLLTSPVTAHAQQPSAVRRIGILTPFSASDSELWLKALMDGLHQLGWDDGKNLIVDYRYSDGNLDRLPKLVADLIQLKVEIIVTSVTNDTIDAKNATKTIPIVMAAAGDPVATGIVSSLAQPGGNVTGLSQMNPDLAGKRLELLKAINPRIASLAVIFHPNDPISPLNLREIEQSAQKLAIRVQSFSVRNSREMDSAFDTIARDRLDALAILPNSFFITNLKRFADFALRQRLPSIFHIREFARAGGLLSYGVDRIDLYRRAASYVDKILKGASPAALPVEQPTKFELAINLKTAKALGLTIPTNLLFTADEVIE